jgi:hypothetical protein
VALPRPSGEPLGAEPLAERAALDEVRERALAVDLDDGQMLSVTGLEARVAVDLDEPQLERELGLRVLQHLERAVAEVTPGPVVERDDGYG